MRRLSGLAALLLALAAAPSVAHADFGLVPDGFKATALDAANQPELRAGAHPDRLLASFAFNTLADGGADGNVKDVVIDLPSGLVGDPGAVPTCARTAFERGTCGAESQVGVMHATFAALGNLDFPLYNVTPHEGELAEFGFFALIFPVRFVIGVRADGDHATQIQLLDLLQNIPLTAGKVELWGVPADHQSGTTIPRKPLLTNPTSCDGGPTTTTLRVRSWQQPDAWIAATSAASAALTGCDALAFEPSLRLGLDTPTADTPSGMSLELTLPQDDSPDGRATSQTRDLSATLPGGLTLSPGVADGLTACDDDQFGIGSARTAACPPSSKIGTVELTTSVLDQPLEGEMYFGRPLATDRFRLLLAAAGRGITLKLVGSLRPDAHTGQLSVALGGLPTLPFSHMMLHFKDGPRAPLATPPRCGAGAATANVTAYRGGAPAHVAAPIEISSRPDGTPCPRVAPFAPLLVAGSSPPVGGRSSAFSLTVRRADAQQALDRFSVTLPAGLSARLASVARCPTEVAVTGSCNVASRIGSVALEAGAGATPLPLTGDAYLTGPHDGAPFGLALVLHPQVGPLDLGMVVVLATLRLDPLDARITIATDPLPQLLGGIPLRLRTLALDIDRRGFMLDPTSCDATQIAATFTSIDEATSASAARYALGGCGGLRFAPAVALSLGSRSDLRQGAHPRLTIALHSHPGQAAISAATIQLPGVLTLDPSAVTEICARRQAAEGRCPSGSSVGSARVRTPLLPHPLTGSVDVVQPRRGLQPELWATVAGMGLRLSLRSTTSAPVGKPISARFVGLPDIPLSSVALTLRDGPHGLLTLTRALCAGRAPRRIVVGATLRGHNGALDDVRVRVGAHPSC